MTEEYLANAQEILPRIYFQYSGSFRIVNPQYLAQDVRYFPARKPMWFLGDNSLKVGRDKRPTNGYVY